MKYSLIMCLLIKYFLIKVLTYNEQTFKVFSYKVLSKKYSVITNWLLKYAHIKYSFFIVSKYG